MRCLVEIDEAQAEWVVTAFLSRDDGMLKVIREKLNPHAHTGALISGAPKSFIAAEKELVGHASDPTVIASLRRELPSTWEGLRVADFFLPRTMSIYQAGKKSNHGLNYNMQYKRFALENEMPETDASRIVSLYRDVAYPGLKRYYREVEAELTENNRVLRNCFGQTLKLLDRWGPDLLDAAYAFKPQSTVGNITKWGWRYVYEDTTRLRRVEPGPNVHDSIVTQNDFDSVDELGEQINLCSDYLATPFTYHGVSHIIPREVKVGLNWGEYHPTTNPLGMRDVEVDDDSHVDLASLQKVWSEVSAAAEM